VDFKCLHHTHPNPKFDLQINSIKTIFDIKLSFCPSPLWIVGKLSPCH